MENRIWWVASPDKDKEKTKPRKGPWTKDEDMQLIGYISIHGEGRWDFLAKTAGLKRTGKSCRLRWNNCLRPDLKRSKISPEEERLITKLHGRWGNRWSRIARSLPGRTDNEIKNYWRTRFNRKQNLQAGSGNNCMDGDNRVQIEGSIGSHCLTSSSQRSPEPDCTAESSSSFTMQTTEGIAVHTNKTPYLQDNIWAQAIPFSEGDYEIALQVQIHDVSSQIDDDGQPGISSQEQSGGLDNLVEKSLLNNFSASSLATLICSELFAADAATQDANILHSLSCIVDSPDTLSDDEYYMIDYSDVLWNMDAEDDCFISSPNSTLCVDRGSY